MKSTVFEIKPLNDSTDKIDGNDGTFVYKIFVPTLNAYAFEYATLHLSSHVLFVDPSCIKDSDLEIHTKFSFASYDCRLVVHYHGIRDYALLFPNVEPKVLQERLGEFYKEAESFFENAAWLAFMLMCGAIFEGILFSKIQKKIGFGQLIEKAHKENHIDNDAKEIMNKVRNYRNIVHANRTERAPHEPYVNRVDVMDTRRLLDAIIKNS